MNFDEMPDQQKVDSISVRPASDKPLMFDDLPDHADTSEPADHGLSERQKLSPFGKAISPITSYPETYDRMNREAREQMSRGFNQITHPESLIDPNAHGISDVLTGAGNMALGGIGYVGSPISAAYRSLVGQPVEDVTGIPREYTEFAAQLATPGIGLTGAGKRPPSDLPGFSSAPALPPSPGTDVVSAAERASQVAPAPINVPRAFASDNIATQRAGQLARNVPFVGDSIPRATGRMVDEMGNAVNSIATHYGEGSGPNVANRIGRHIGDAAEQETSAATNAARASDDALLADWQRSHDDVIGQIGQHETNALDAARSATGDMSPQEMGAALIDRLRQGEREARATKERLYGIAGNSDASIKADAVSGLSKDVKRSLDEEGHIVDDPVLTPFATRMMAELENAPLRMPGSTSTEHARNVADIRQKYGPEVAATYERQKAADVPKAQSLLEFIASKGGLGPDAELEAIGAQGHTVNVEGVGRRKLVRQGGWPLDYAREAAEGAGYLRGNHNGTSGVNDLLDAMDAEMRGQKRYPEGFEGSVSKREGVARSEREQHELDAHTRGLEDDLAAAGHGNLGPDVKARATRLMANEGMDADTAVEHSLRQLEQEDNAVHQGSSFPGDRPAGAKPAGSAVTMQALEQTRKRLNMLAQGATNDADRRAARQVIKSFDDWLGNAFDNALFSGSDESLKAYRAARAANTEWRQRFGFNERDDADKIINKVVTGEITPQEMSNWLVGATRVGSKGVSSRLLTRIGQATENDPAAMDAIRGGVANRLFGTVEGVDSKNATTVANGIYEFFNGSGRDVANRLFTPQQRQVAVAYADTLRRGVEARAVIGEAAKNSKPSAMVVNPGPMQQLATSVLGKGGKSDEALFSAIDSYARSGSRGDIKTLAEILRSVPEKEKGDLAGAIIRKLGQSKTTGQFSPDVFASEWNKYTPQAKTLLLGNAGAHRQALDDIAMISQRYKDVGRRFGNPSGTAQNAVGLGAVASIFTHPYLAIPSLIGGAIFSKILSAPATAQRAAFWGKTANALSKGQTPARLLAFENASKSLAAASNKLGAHVNTGDFMRLLQGPVPVGADQKQQ